MPSKKSAALEEFDRRLKEKLKGVRLTLDTKEKDPLKQVTDAHFTIDVTGIMPPLSLDEIWKHCLKRHFTYTRAVSVGNPNKVDIDIRR